MARPFLAVGGDGEVSAWAAAATVVLAAEMDRAWTVVDPSIWGDEKRMKRELVAWAKAVVSMASAGKNTSSATSPSSPWPSMRRRG